MTETNQQHTNSNDRVSPPTVSTASGTQKQGYWDILFNFLRGALIGAAELVPGISGGTIALVTGIYEKIIFNAHAFLSALKDLPKNREKSVREIKAIDWRLLIPIAIGMILLVFTMSGTIQRLTSGDNFVASRALFTGMVLASVAVPLLMISPEDRRTKKANIILGFVIGMVLGLILTSFSRGEQANPPLWLVFIAAMIAVCALVMPGVSGSFFLLAIGIYSATLTAVDSLNVPYILTFLAGAFAGIMLFINGLNWLLTNKRTITLSVGAGLLLGSLRALWPWQKKLPNGAMTQIAPYGSMTLPIILFLVGFALVSLLVYADHKIAQRDGIDAA